MIKKEEIFSDLEKNEEYVIDNVLNDIGLFHYKNNRNKTGLINLKNGNIIGEVREYKNIHYKSFYIQSFYELDRLSINLVRVKKISNELLEYDKNYLEMIYKDIMI